MWRVPVMSRRCGLPTERALEMLSPGPLWSQFLMVGVTAVLALVALALLAAIWLRGQPMPAARQAVRAMPAARQAMRAMPTERPRVPAHALPDGDTPGPMTVTDLIRRIRDEDRWPGADPDGPGADDVATVEIPRWRGVPSDANEYPTTPILVRVRWRYDRPTQRSMPSQYWPSSAGPPRSAVLPGFGSVRVVVDRPRVAGP
ncbi:hypothetical protein F0L68_25370 [Solihabitans fulvus]|uniref:Uncharacterized protein n=1 Tax=Solihabitans fulvus TaxID=1892852 RepID=A0A5B2X1K7_9PSEU|nr:hypothetical protein [Solihabitans fulvus]KAA2257079.1 hypothetical protein F0L68_25370 [Solihabitans fulvus]